MPVIGIDQVPANFQTPTMWDRYGSYTGQKLDKLEDAILAYLTSGMYKGQQKTIPNPTYSPNGAVPTLNPDVSMTYDPGAFPKAPLVSSQVPSSILSQISTPKPQGAYSTQPLINADTFKRIQELQAYRKNEEEIKSAPGEREANRLWKESLTRARELEAENIKYERRKEAIERAQRDVEIGVIKPAELQLRIDEYVKLLGAEENVEVAPSGDGAQPTSTAQPPVFPQEVEVGQSLGDLARGMSANNPALAAMVNPASGMGSLLRPQLPQTRDDVLAGMIPPPLLAIARGMQSKGTETVALPDPQKFRDGDVIREDASGARYINRKGKWKKL